AKSPMNNYHAVTNFGGYWGAELRHAGCDHLVISGASAQPVYLYINNEQVEIRDARHLWGLDTYQTAAELRRELRDEDIQVLTIGPAGENLVRFACLTTHLGDAAGRTGMGAVMGAKKLKAVAVRGRKWVTVADPPGYLELCRELDQQILDHPEYAQRRTLGSTLLMKALNRLGILPTNHFQQGLCAYVERVSGERLAQEFKVKNKSCFNCNIHCSRYYLTAEVECEGPEYETLCSYTSRTGNDDLEFALNVNAFLNRMGIDSLSSGETIGWAMECVQRGLLTKDDLDGLDFTWGNRQTIAELLPKIVRREGIGDAFAEGTRSLARRFGRGTEDYAFHVKGLDMICGDPRGIKAFGLTYAIASRGGDHLRAEPFFELTQRYEEAEKRWGIREIADRLSDQGKAVLVEHTERQALLTDCLTMCKNIGLSMDLLDFDFASRLLCAGTGLQFTPERIDEVLKGIIERDRRLNIDFGVTGSQDTLPPRFTDEPLEAGASRGTVVPVARMVKEYYQIKGWDEQGNPGKL
ncbi:MAG: aldehyde ferredoxin oxidoreductase family protein, partial [Desulfobacterales bacterium]